jgi:hypothetical protein
MKCVRCWVRRPRVDLTEDPLLSGPDSMIERQHEGVKLSDSSWQECFFEEMLQPLRIQPRKFLGMRVVKRKQSFIQRSGPRYFERNNRLQLSIAHATSPTPGDLFILDVADHGGLGD